jgi:polar amino acid transport system permease protein
MRVLQNLNFGKAIAELLPKLIQQSLGIVVLTTIVGFILAIAIGFLLALGRLSKHKWLSGIIVAFQELIRGTPLLVQLVYMYYVVPLLIEVLAYLIGIDYKCNMPAVTAGIVGIGINYGTYLSEVIRSAIIAIDSGQTEAALALAMSPRQAMFRIVLPQAFRSSIPVFGNYLVMLVKDTSLMAYITAPEFLLVTKAYTSQTFLTIESYTILAVVYLVICIPLSWLVKMLENKFNKRFR